MPLVSRSVRAFIAVAEELHFGRAAERLHISQPPLSQQIREFEKAVGAVLLIRTTRSVQLTPAGTLMLERARQLVNDADATLKAVSRVARGESGNLTLGFTHSTVYGVLPRVLRAYRKRSPAVKLELKQLTSDLLIEGVRAGRIDVALARLPESMLDEFEAKVVAREPMVLVMPAGHLLASHKQVPVKALQGQPFIDYAQDAARYFHELVGAIFAAAGVQPQVTHSSFLPTMFALVEAGMGVALVPASAVPERAGSLVSRPLAGSGKARAVLYSAWRRDNVNPAVTAFGAILATLKQASR